MGRPWWSFSIHSCPGFSFSLIKTIITQKGDGQRHLLICDNLGSQTKKVNPKFSKLMSDMTLCHADVWNLLAGCTDELQVVDAGVGACTKRHADDVMQEWFQDDANWAEWTGANLSARRKRILITHWYAEAYDRMCKSFNFTKVTLNPSLTTFP